MENFIIVFVMFHLKSFHSETKPMIYNAWKPGEPSGDGLPWRPCLEKNFPPNTVPTWNDILCGRQFSFICQQDALPSVLYETNYPHSADLSRLEDIQHFLYLAL